MSNKDYKYDRKQPIDATTVIKKNERLNKNNYWLKRKLRNIADMKRMKERKAKWKEK